MKILILLTIIVLSACKDSKTAENLNNLPVADVEVHDENENLETYKTMDIAVVKSLNDSILTRNLKTEEEIMHFYKPKSIETEGNYTYSITKHAIDNDSKEVILIEDGLLDDALAAIKTTMILKIENSLLKVISIKENYKCQQNRGHQFWSATLCD